MKITVLNGSPKGDLSVTLQYVRYLTKKNPEIEFKVFNIAQMIRRIERDQAAFSEIIDHVRSSDGVLWSFPLYILLVHGSYKRFIELLFERKTGDAFKDKYAATISTSIHYFDHTAHNYVHAICDDLGMRFVGSFSPRMDDLRDRQAQTQLIHFGDRFFEAIHRQQATQRLYPPVEPHTFDYQPGPAAKKIQLAGKKMTVLYDSDAPNQNLSQMVQRITSSVDGPVEVMDIQKLDIHGGCLGCLKCGGKNRCAYEEKDGFTDFYRQSVMKADILVFAGAIKDRYLSARWKTVFDRAFFNTHTPALTGKQLAFVVSGPYSQIANLDEVLKGWAEFQLANLAAVISDEVQSSSHLDTIIDQTVNLLVESAVKEVSKPLTFLGFGGAKVFRDDIWGGLRFVFYADHLAYQRIKLYDTFPQADWKFRLFNIFIVPLLQIGVVRKVFDKQVKVRMVEPLQQIVEKA